MSDPQSPGPAAPAPGTADPPPSTLRLAVGGMWAGAALSVVGTAVSLAKLEAERRDVGGLFDEHVPGEHGPTPYDALIGVSALLAIGTGMIWLGLWIWMAIANRRGVAWARILATVFGAFNILWRLAAVVVLIVSHEVEKTSDVVGVILDGLDAVLAIAILMLLWNPRSTAYYAARTLVRRQISRAAPRASAD